MNTEKEASVNLQGKRSSQARLAVWGAIAAELRACGAYVIGTGTREMGSDFGPCHEYVQADFTRLDDILACAGRVRQSHPDILINNAGITKITPILDLAL